MLTNRELNYKIMLKTARISSVGAIVKPLKNGVLDLKNSLSLVLYNLNKVLEKKIQNILSNSVEAYLFP